MNILYTIGGILIPFLGTTLGSAFVFFMKGNLNDKVNKFIIGFASGVMIAASIWSLIMPSIDLSADLGSFKWIPATIGLLLGVLFLIVVNYYVNALNKKNKEKKLDMLIFSVTLHNIPEGMAVGVCFLGFLSGNAGITLISALVLALGIAIQNIPEGAIISMPMKLKGEKKKKSFICGVLSGVVEPIAALMTIILIKIIGPMLPYCLSFAAGAMIYVVIEELIPEMHEKSRSFIGVMGVTMGFLVMMVLDVTLG